jgi:mono/diheme cytochrome c family protein
LLPDKTGKRYWRAAETCSAGRFLRLRAIVLFLALLLVGLGLAACTDNAIENQPAKQEVIDRFKATPDDPNGNARNGAIIFAKLPCISCHALGSAGGGVGPALDKIGTNAATRIPGVTAAQYLHHILTNPEDASLPDYRNTTMPSFATSATKEELRDLVAFLLTQK